MAAVVSFNIVRRVRSSLTGDMAFLFTVASFIFFTLIIFPGLTAQVLALICIVIIPFEAIEAVKQIQSKESYRIARTEVERFAGSLPRGAEGAVIIPSGVYFLYKPMIKEILDQDYIGSGLPMSRLEGYAGCYMGLLPGQAPVVNSSYASHLRLFARAASRYVPTIFGRRLTRREWGWSCDQYVRASPGAEAGLSR